MEDKLNIESKEREGPSNGSIRAKVMVFYKEIKEETYLFILHQYLKWIENF